MMRRNASGSRTNENLTSSTLGTPTLRQHLTRFWIVRAPAENVGGVSDEPLPAWLCGDIERPCRLPSPNRISKATALAASAARRCDPALSALAFPESMSEMPRTTHP